MPQCKYYPYTQCNEEAVINGYCEKHAKSTCIVCDNQAVCDCAYEGKYLACGAPLCAEHTGITFENDNMEMEHRHN